MCVSLLVHTTEPICSKPTAEGPFSAPTLADVQPSLVYTMKNGNKTTKKQSSRSSAQIATTEARRKARRAKHLAKHGPAKAAGTGKRAQKKAAVAEARKNADAVVSSGEEGKPRFSHTYGRTLASGKTIPKPRLQGNKDFDRSMVGKPIEGGRCLDPIVSAASAVLRAAALDLISAQREQDSRVFKKVCGKAEMPVVERVVRPFVKPARLWPIAGFQPTVQKALEVVRSSTPITWEQVTKVAARRYATLISTNPLCEVVERKKNKKNRK